jgi:hypothetical protein
VCPASLVRIKTVEINMDDSRQSDLTRMLRAFDERRGVEIRERDAARLAIERFLTASAEIIDLVIMPSFQRFSDELKAHGHPCSVEVQKVDAADKRSEAKITLTVFPAGATFPNGNPSLSYAASSHRGKVAAQRYVAMRSGSAIPNSVGEFDLHQINPALVDGHLLDLARTIFES